MHSRDRSRAYALVVGRLIKFERRSRGIDQIAFAAGLGVSNSAVSRLEAGIYLADQNRLARVAAQLGLSIEQLDLRIRFALDQSERLARSAIALADGTDWWVQVERELGEDALHSIVELGVVIALRRLK